MFFALMLVFVLAALSITYKILVGYTSLSLFWRLLVLVSLVCAWFSPVLLRLIRKMPLMFHGAFYEFSYKIGYFLMGFALILFILLFVRDILWHIVFYVSKSQALNPNNAHMINVLNVYTIALALLISFYGLFEAHQQPYVEEVTIQDAKIKQPLKIVVASDLHINQSTPIWHINKMINQINNQEPDYILLVGDIADDDLLYALPKIRLLSKLKAKKIYLTLGNHEYYHNPYSWMKAFSDLGFQVLQNTGETIEATGLYIAGVPDTGSARVFYNKAFETSKDEFKILMSHSPADFKTINQDMFDLQVSGHTHGGQIFPFQYLTKKANNGYLEGLYQEKAKLFISKGAGYWGPPMRIGARPDIVRINLVPADYKEELF